VISILGGEIKAVYIFDEKGVLKERVILKDISKLAELIRLEQIDVKEPVIGESLEILFSLMITAGLSLLTELNNQLRKLGVDFQIITRKNPEAGEIIFAVTDIKYNKDVPLKSFLQEVENILSRVKEGEPKVDVEIEIPEKVRMGEEFYAKLKILNKSNNPLEEVTVEGLEEYGLEIIEIKRQKIAGKIIIGKVEPEQLILETIKMKANKKGSHKLEIKLEYKYGKKKDQKFVTKTMEVTE